MRDDGRVNEREQRPDERRRGARALLGRLLPYAVAGACVFFVLQRHSPADIVAEVARAEAWMVLPLPPLMVLATLFIMAVSDTILLKHFFPTARFWDVLRGRGACVSLEVVNYGVGKGTYGLWLARRYGARPWLAGGLALYVVAGELCSMCLVGSGAILLGDVDLPPLVVQMALGLAGLLVLCILTGPFQLIPDVPVLRPWTQLPRWRGLLHVGVRVVQHSFGVVVTAFGARWFGLDVPLAILIAYIPAIAVLSALPLNVFGIGLAQGAWLLLEPWAPGEKLVAFSLVWGATMTVSVVLRGLPFIKRVSKEIGRGSQAADVEVEDAAPVGVVTGESSGG